VAAEAAHQRSPQRGDGAGPADDQSSPVHQNLVAGGRVGITSHVGHTPARTPTCPVRDTDAGLPRREREGWVRTPRQGPDEPAPIFLPARALTGSVAARGPGKNSGQNPRTSSLRSDRSRPPLEHSVLGRPGKWLADIPCRSWSNSEGRGVGVQAVVSLQVVPVSRLPCRATRRLLAAR